MADQTQVGLEYAEVLGNFGVPSTSVILYFAEVLGTIAAGVPVTTVAITGNKASTKVGTVTTTSTGSKSFALSQVAATTRVGVLRDADAEILNGNKAIGKVTKPFPGTTTALGGNKAATKVGSVTVPVSGNVTVGITGNKGTSLSGHIVASHSYAAVGNRATAKVNGLPAATVSRTLSGNKLTGVVGSVQRMEAVAINGNKGITRVGSVVAGQSITKALSGNRASAVVGYVGNSGAGSVRISGVVGVGRAGQLVASYVRALSAVHGTSRLGSITQSRTIGLRGNVAAGRIGSLAQTRTLATPGNRATAKLGSLIYSLQFGLSMDAAVGTVHGFGNGTDIAAVLFNLVPMGNNAFCKVGRVSPGPRGGPQVLVSSDIISQLVVNLGDNAFAKTATSDMLVIIPPVNVTAG